MHLERLLEKEKKREENASSLSLSLPNLEQDL